MSLLRLLVELFAPTRQTHRHRPTVSKPRTPKAAIETAPSERTAPWQVVQGPWVHSDRPSGHHVIKGHCWVIDGDTIVINKICIRLAGIDAPELDHPYGQVAKRVLMGLCRGQVITATTDGSSSYERTVAVCHLADGRDLSAEMVKAGFALDWRRYSGGRYRHLEVEGTRKKLWRVDAKHKGLMPPS
jgi:endonuclease YncB( thermonuclease family)